jgi:hypothetical protein
MRIWSHLPRFTYYALHTQIVLFTLPRYDLGIIELWMSSCIHTMRQSESSVLLNNPPRNKHHLSELPESPEEDQDQDAAPSSTTPWETRTHISRIPANLKPHIPTHNTHAHANGATHKYTKEVPHDSNHDSNQRHQYTY